MRWKPTVPLSASRVLEDVGISHSGLVGRIACGKDPTVWRVPEFVEDTRVATTDDAATAFDRYVVPEIDVLYRVARSLTRDPTDAEDLIQDTMLRAFRSVTRFDGRHPRAWLLTIMRNAQTNRVRRRRPGLLDDPDTIDRMTPMGRHAERDPAEVVAESGFDAVVERAYLGLSDDFRSVVDLVDLAGLSYAEAAAVLDVPEGTVMSRLHRARRRIRSDLEAAGVTKGRK